jgi:hypothetical protein
MAHFHIPKPLHGRREFVGEVGIIVLGVLIALGAEQTVEALHNQYEVRKTEEPLRDNFKRFAMYAGELDFYAPCLTARAAQVSQLLDRSAAAHRLPRVGAIPQLPPHPWQIDTYSAMVASQAITHVPTDRAILYSRIATSAVDLHEVSLDAWASWGSLASLTGAGRSFGQAEEAQDRAILARAVHQDAVMRTIADRTVDRIRNTGLLNDRSLDSAVAEGKEHAAHMDMCRPIDLQL